MSKTTVTVEPVRRAVVGFFVSSPGYDLVLVLETCGHAIKAPNNLAPVAGQVERCPHCEKAEEVFLTHGLRRENPGDELCRAARERASSSVSGIKRPHPAKRQAAIAAGRALDALQALKVLERSPLLDEEDRELATKALQSLGFARDDLVQLLARVREKSRRAAQ